MLDPMVFVASTAVVPNCCCVLSRMNGCRQRWRWFARSRRKNVMDDAVLGKIRLFQGITRSSGNGRNRVDINHCVALLINSNKEITNIELRSFSLHKKCAVHAKITVRLPSGYHPLVER